MPSLPCIAVLFSFIFISCGPLWRSPDHVSFDAAIELAAPILTAEQYGEKAATHPRPYIVAIDTSLLLFGATHTKNPFDPQIDSMRALWKIFSPTVVLVEGRLGFLFRWSTDPVEKFGESGWAADKAKHERISLYTWEPLFEEEIAWTLKKFPQKRVALFYILRPYFGQVKFGKPDDPDAWVEGTIGRRTKVKGLEGSLRSVAEIDSIWRADFPEKKDWRDTDDRYGWVGYLNDIAKESNAYRDEHFARAIIQLVRNGERVFAVAGSSHAVKLENALRSTLR